MGTNKLCLLAISFACFGLNGCGRTSSATVDEPSKQASESAITLECDVTTTNHDTGTQASPFREPSMNVDYYRVDPKGNKILSWDDKAAKFVDVCYGMTCKKSVSRSEITWERNGKNDAKSSPLMFYSEENTISRSTGRLSGHKLIAVYNGITPLVNNRVRSTGKCKKSDFTGRKLEF